MQKKRNTKDKQTDIKFAFALFSHQPALSRILNFGKLQMLSTKMSTLYHTSHLVAAGCRPGEWPCAHLLEGNINNLRRWEEKRHF